MARKAIVLAAGFGNRLRPFTAVTPKPLMPVWGEPMLARIVAQLRALGVDDIVVNCHHLHEQVEVWCAANGCRAVYEPEILGTGGVLNPLRDWIGQDEFFLVNGDIVIENLPAAFRRPMSDAREAGAETLGICLVTTEGPRTIEVEPEHGWVTNWKSDDPGWEGTYTYCGFARLKSEILDYVAPSGFSSIVAAYESAMMSGKFIKAVTADDLMWTDAGTVTRYLELNQSGEENAYEALPQVAAALSATGFDGQTPVALIGARGSDRVFFRAGGGVVVAYDDATRAENARYAGHAKWLLSQGMPVPQVLADLPERKTLVMADGGREKKMTLEEYVKVVEALVRFGALGARAAEELSLEPAFDAALWGWERDLFAEHCLGARFHRTLSPAVENELKNVAALLEREPKALVHRDFQSTNVLWRGDDFVLIDFQGMRLGPAAYDLASLVYDPYVHFSEGERRALVALYAKKAGRPELVKTLPYAAVQRLVQCLGAYGRLASVGQPRFGAYVRPALENLLDAADCAGLDAVGALAEDLIAEEERRPTPEGGHDCACGHPHGPGHVCTCGHHHDE